MGAAISSRPGLKPYQIVLAWLGGFIPDASIFLMVAYSRFAEVSGAGLWRAPNGLYWQEPWQFFSAVSNSIPMWIVLSVLGLVLFIGTKALKTIGLSLLIFSSAALVHVLIDLATHARDAHVHFWPLTDWRFHSPLSYYDPAFHGKVVGMFEAIMGLGIITYLVINYKNWPVRILSVLFAAPYFLSAWFIINGTFS